MNTNADNIQKTRAAAAARGQKRAEFWVPQDLTREEKNLIQQWMDQIVEDARNEQNTSSS